MGGYRQRHFQKSPIVLVLEGFEPSMAEVTAKLYGTSHWPIAIYAFKIGDKTFKNSYAWLKFLQALQLVFHI